VTTVTEVRSESYGLITERRHHNGRHRGPARDITEGDCDDLCVVSRAFSTLCVHWTFGHHAHPYQATFVANFVFATPSTAELAVEKNCVLNHSLSQSLTQLI